MMRASQAAAVLDLSAIPVHSDAVRMAALPGDGRTPLDHALADGEDFELVLVLPAEAGRALAAEAAAALGTPVTIIGEVVEGAGLFSRTAAGQREPLAPRGFVHAFDS
jgi:thiamine-monophosphate kinase